MFLWMFSVSYVLQFAVIFQQREIVYCSRLMGGYHLKVSLIGRWLLTNFNWVIQQDQGSAEGNHATLISTDGWIALIRLMWHIHWISVCVMLFILFGFVDGNISISLDRCIPYHDVMTILSYFITFFFLWFGLRRLAHWSIGKPANPTLIFSCFSNVARRFWDLKLPFDHCIWVSSY